jgi:predicted O-methyltransferase YrrM
MLNVNRKRLSRAIWDTLFADLPDLPWHVIEDLEKLDPARRTGSTNHASLIALWAVIRHFRPKVVAEIGTYIGKSTFVLAREGANVHTCDMTHDFKLPLTTSITQYHSSSTEMLAKLDGNIDLLHLDGRLQPDDKPHLERLFTPETVITLDDFEGIEKGVWNAMQIDLSQRILVYPPERELTERYAVGDATTAIILPNLRLTPQ